MQNNSLFGFIFEYMRAILIPVDFSSSMDNTLRFAARWAQAYGYKRIILLKSSNQTVFDQIVVSADYMMMKQHFLSEERVLLDAKAKMLIDYLEEGPAAIRVYSSLSDQPLLRSILEITNTEGPELIITGSNRPEEVISIAKTSPIRVLIVPPSYEYQPVEEALLPVDFRTIDQLSRFDLYQAETTFLAKTRLLVLNIVTARHQIEPDEHFLSIERALHGYLKHFQHEIFYSDHPEIIEGILKFAIQHPVQLLIALPGHHSFLYRLTHKSISEAILRNAQIPVLILK
jgi:nucleotide-binding universal stress UspA family protein